MKAIITKQNKDDSFDEVGMNNRMITGEYKTERNLIKYGIPEHFKKHICRIELYRNIHDITPFKTLFIKPKEN